MKPFARASSPRLFLGVGVAILIAISAASIGLDVKSRSDAQWVNHTLDVLKKLSDTALLITRAESASRGFYQTSDRGFFDDYHATLELVAPAFAELEAAMGDNPAQAEALAGLKLLVGRRLAITSEMVRLLDAGDNAGVAALTARAQGRPLMRAVTASFDRLAAEEKRLLSARSEASQRTGRLLLAVDLAGAALILVLAAILVSDAQRARRAQDQDLRATAAANERLEAAVAERTQKLFAAHEELRRSMAILHSTFASMTEAVLVLDTQGDILFSNPAAEQLLSYRSGMSLGQLWAELTPFQADGTTPLARADTPAARAMRGEQFAGQELILRRKGRRDPVHLVANCRSLYDVTGAVSGAAIVYHDLTAARETERKLLQAQKLEAMGQLTGGVAHDFNNMLTVITGMTEMLVLRLQDQPELLDAAELIDQAADRCSELIRHLLAFARKQPLQPRHVDINTAIEDIAKLLRPTLGEQIDIRLALQNGLPTALVDPSQLSSVMLNLAINARDAMPGGGKLMLETASVCFDAEDALPAEDVRPGAYVMIAVSDTGTGMPADVLARVFEPFFTTKAVGKGSGLGLSMAFGFVKQSNGHIKVYSEPGYGTTIKLYLPPASGDVEVSAPPLAPLPGESATILVVEDEALVRNFVVGQLQSLGYRTVAVADGGAALSQIEGDQPFDLLFTDLIMPGGVTGSQLANEMRRRRPRTKVLFTSGYTHYAIEQQGRLDEGVLLLSKPYRKAVLAEMVRRALGREAA